jgi:hypothetical protein
MGRCLLLAGEGLEADIGVSPEVELVIAGEKEVVLGDALATGHCAHSLII